MEKSCPEGNEGVIHRREYRNCGHHSKKKIIKQAPCHQLMAGSFFDGGGHIMLKDNLCAGQPENRFDAWCKKKLYPALAVIHTIIMTENDTKRNP